MSIGSDGKMGKMRINMITGISSRAILLIMIAALALSFGCSSLNKPKTGITQADTHVGFSGIDMSFLQNAPPSQLLTMPDAGRTQFQVGVKLDNKGAYDIKDGYMLLGTEKDYMEIMQWYIDDEEITPIGASGEKVAFDLKGKSQTDPTGMSIVAIADIETLPLEKQSVTHTSSIILTACYDYETFAAAEVCIDTDLYNMKPLEKACSAKDITLTKGQGAPVSVDKIEVSMFSTADGFIKPQFIIYPTNKGKGMVFRNDKVRQACSSTPLGPDDLNMLVLEDISFSGYSMSAGLIECNPNPLRLRGPESKIVCTTKPGVISTESDTYKTNLQLTFKYGYTQSISKSMTISRP